MPMPPGFKPLSTDCDWLSADRDDGQRETEAAFFPADQIDSDNPAPQKLTPTAKGLMLDLKKDANLTANPTQLSGVLELSGGRALMRSRLPGTGCGGGALRRIAAAATAAAATQFLPQSQRPQSGLIIAAARSRRVRL